MNQRGNLFWQLDGEIAARADATDAGDNPGTVKCTAGARLSSPETSRDQHLTGTLSQWVSQPCIYYECELFGKARVGLQDEQRTVWRGGPLRVFSGSGGMQLAPSAHDTRSKRFAHNSPSTVQDPLIHSPIQRQTRQPALPHTPPCLLHRAHSLIRATPDYSFQ